MPKKKGGKKPQAASEASKSAPQPADQQENAVSEADESTIKSTSEPAPASETTAVESAPRPDPAPAPAPEPTAPSDAPTNTAEASNEAPATAGDVGADFEVVATHEDAAKLSAPRELRGLEITLQALGVVDMIMARVEGPMTQALALKAAARVQTRHPHLRASISFPEGQRPVVTFHDPDESRLDVHEITAAEVDSFTDGQPLWHRVWAQCTRHTFAYEQGYLFFVRLIADGDHTRLILGAPHSLMDGAGSVRLLHDFLTQAAAVYAAEMVGDSPEPLQPLEPPIPAVDQFTFSWLEHKMVPWAAARQWVKTVKAFESPFIKSGTDARLKDSDEFNTHWYFATGEPDSLATMRTRCKQEDTTVGTALMASSVFALVRAMHRAGKPPVPDAFGSITVPLDVDYDMRRRCDPPVSNAAISCYSSLSTLQVSFLVAHDTFWDVARKCKDAINKAFADREPQHMLLFLDQTPDPVGFLRDQGVDNLNQLGTQSLINVSSIGPYPYEDVQGPFAVREYHHGNALYPSGPTGIVWGHSVANRMMYNAAGASPLFTREGFQLYFDDVVDLMENRAAEQARFTLFDFLAGQPVGDEGVEEGLGGVMWVKDGASMTCASCGASFWLFRRRHHCRNCGDVFCAECSSHTAALPHLGSDAPLRICDGCHESLGGAEDVHFDLLPGSPHPSDPSKFAPSVSRFVARTPSSGNASRTSSAIEALPEAASE